MYKMYRSERGRDFKSFGVKINSFTGFKPVVLRTRFSKYLKIFRPTNRDFLKGFKKKENIRSMCIAKSLNTTPLAANIYQ